SARTLLILRFALLFGAILYPRYLEHLVRPDTKSPIASQSLAAARVSLALQRTGCVIQAKRLCPRTGSRNIYTLFVKRASCSATQKSRSTFKSAGDDTSFDSNFDTMP